MTKKYLKTALVALAVSAVATAAFADHIFVDHTQDSNSYIDVALVSVDTDGYLEAREMIAGEPGRLLDTIQLYAGANDNLRFRHGEFPNDVMLMLYSSDNMLLDTERVKIVDKEPVSEVYDNESVSEDYFY